MNNDLMQKLLISKKIMDRHSEIPRNSSSGSIDSMTAPTLQEFGSVQGNYNIPQEFLSEESIKPKPSKNFENSSNLVLNSKLPDEIKRLMIEHPIQQPKQPSVTLSDDVIEAAARLMKKESNTNSIQNNSKTQSSQKPNINENLDIKKLVKEAVKEILQENGLLIESAQKADDLFSFRVGQHIFEGKVTKIKKIK